MNGNARRQNESVRFPVDLSILREHKISLINRSIAKRNMMKECQAKNQHSRFSSGSINTERTQDITYK